MKIKLVSLILILFVASILVSCSSNVSKNITNSKIQVEENDNNKDNKNKEEKNEREIFLENIKTSGKEGRVIDCSYVAGKSIMEEVRNQWGAENKIDFVEDAKGIYYTYNEKDIVFGCNKGEVIFEVRSYNPELKQLSKDDIKAYFGIEDYDSTSSTGETILGYKLNEDYKVLFVFENNSGENRLDHYSVLYPEGTKNMMADDKGREW